MCFGPLTALNLTSGNRAVVDMYVCGLLAGGLLQCRPHAQTVEI